MTFLALALDDVFMVFSFISMDEFGFRDRQPPKRATRFPYMRNARANRIIRTEKFSEESSKGRRLENHRSLSAASP